MLTTVNTELLELERKIVDCIRTRDAATFQAMTAPEAFSIEGMGVIPNAAFVEYWKDMQIESLELSDMRVVPISQDAAVVVYRLTQKASFQGQPFPPVVWASTTYGKRDGKWLAVFHQETPAR